MDLRRLTLPQYPETVPRLSFNHSPRHAPCGVPAHFAHIKNETAKHWHRLRGLALPDKGRLPGLLFDIDESRTSLAGNLAAL